MRTDPAKPTDPRPYTGTRIARRDDQLRTSGLVQGLGCPSDGNSGKGEGAYGCTWKAGKGHVAFPRCDMCSDKMGGSLDIPLFWIETGWAVMAVVFRSRRSVLRFPSFTGWAWGRPRHRKI